MSASGFAARPRDTGLRSRAILDTATSLPSRDRLLLLVPTLAALAFGLASLLVAVPFARLAGYAGNDPFFYWLAEAATLGYGIALAVGIRERSWRGLRAAIVAVTVPMLYGFVTTRTGEQPGDTANG